MTTRPPQQDFIAAAAADNHRDGLTPEQLAIAVPKSELRIEGIVKNVEFGDQLRRTLKAKEDGIWSAEALALQDWSLLDTGNAFYQTGSIGLLMFASFVGGNAELSDRAAIMAGWAEKYEPQPGSPIITYADMPDAAAYFKAQHQEEDNTTSPALDEASLRIREEFPASAAGAPAQATENTLEVDPTIGYKPA